MVGLSTKNQMNYSSDNKQRRMMDKNSIPQHWEVKKLKEVYDKVEKVKRKDKKSDEELSS